MFWQSKFSIFILVGAACLVGLFFYFDQGAKFVTPDEGGNYNTMVRLMAGEGWVHHEPLNAELGNYLKARSHQVLENGDLMMTSFIGLPRVYSWLHSPRLTPLFAALMMMAGLVSFWYIVQRFFNRQISGISVGLLTVFAPYLFVNLRFYLHNGFFVNLLLISVAVLLGLNGWQWRSRRWGRQIEMGSIFFSGLVLGFALITRLSEVFWVAGLMLMVGVFRWQQSGWSVRQLLWHWGLFALGVALPLDYYLSVNQAVFGSPLSFGYRPEVVDTATLGTASAGLWQKVSDVFFPFGIDLGASVYVLWVYVVNFFWWYAVPMILGGVVLWRPWLHRLFDYLVSGFHPKHLIALKQELVKPAVLYMWAMLFVAGWLWLYYGGWEFNDTLSLEEVVMGSSYFRYWLPALVMSMPLAAVGLQAMARAMSKVIRFVSPTFALVFLVASFGLLSVYMAMWQKPEGLLHFRQSAQENQQMLEVAQARIPADSLIITRTLDKVFWPEYPVLPSWNERTKPLVVDYMRYNEAAVSVYLATPVNDPFGIAHLEKTELSEYGLRLEDGFYLGDGWWLWEVELVQ